MLGSEFEIPGADKPNYFWGEVVKQVKMTVSGSTMWHVLYDDGDEEDIEKEDVLKFIQFEQARKHLSFKMGVSIPEVLAALEQMDPPYGLNAAMKLIHIAKHTPGSIDDKCAHWSYYLVVREFYLKPLQIAGFESNPLTITIPPMLQCWWIL